MVDVRNEDLMLQILFCSVVEVRNGGFSTRLAHPANATGYQDEISSVSDKTPPEDSPHTNRNHVRAETILNVSPSEAETVPPSKTLLPAVSPHETGTIPSSKSLPEPVSQPETKRNPYLLNGIRVSRAKTSSLDTFPAIPTTDDQRKRKNVNSEVSIFYYYLFVLLININTLLIILLLSNINNLYFLYQGIIIA